MHILRSMLRAKSFRSFPSSKLLPDCVERLTAEFFEDFEKQSVDYAKKKAKLPQKQSMTVTQATQKTLTQEVAL